MFGRRGKDGGRPAEVQFLHTEYAQPAGAERATYRVYQAGDVATGLEFLRQNPVKEQAVCIIVVTPQGNVGRDFIYLFHEADGRLIELGTRLMSASPMRSDTHCAWCGFFVVPREVPRLRYHEGIGSVRRVVSFDLGKLYTAGMGFLCGDCHLLQCAVCSDLVHDIKSPPFPACRACGGKLGVYTEERGPQDAPQPRRLGANGDKVLLPPDPHGTEMYGLASLEVPWNVDVVAFLARRPLPYLWPDNDRYTRSIRSYPDEQRALRISWTNVFLHHPNPDVVLQCLHAAPPDDRLSYDSLADLLASPTADDRVKTEAAKVLWGLGRETAVRWVLNVLRSRGIVKSDYDARSVHQALNHLRSACPPEKARWLESQLTDEDDD